MVCGKREGFYVQSEFMASASDFLHCSLYSVSFRYHGILIALVLRGFQRGNRLFLFLGDGLGVGRDNIFLWEGGSP